MQLVTNNGTLREQFLDLYPLYRHRFSRLTLALVDFINARPWGVFALVTLICGSMRFVGIASRHLDHDELYTFYIAQAPTLGKLLTLTRTVDLHPPLSYLLVRFSFACFGISTWSCRIPSVIAFVLATGFIFWLMKNVLSSIYGLIALLFLWSGPYSYYALNARPYSLLLCFTSLMLFCWFQASNRINGRRWAVLGVSVGGFGLLLSHVLGVLPFAAVVGAECLRSWLIRKVDWRLCLALSVPLVSVLTYQPLFSHHSKLLFTPLYRPTSIRVLGCYWEPLRYVGTPLLVIAVLAIINLFASRKLPGRDGDLPTTNWPLALLLLGLFLVPLGVAIVFLRTGTAFFDRYGVVMLIPAAVVPAMVLAYSTRQQRSYAAIVAVLLTALFLINSLGKAWLLEPLSSIFPAQVVARAFYLTAFPPVFQMPLIPPMPPSLLKTSGGAPTISRLDTLRPELPLVAGTALTFMELDRTESNPLTSRLFLLTNREAAATIVQDTIFEDYEELKAVFPIRGTVEPYCSFSTKHPHFVVLGSYRHAQGWLLRKLEMDGAQLTIIGTYPITYDEHDLYEVKLPANPCPTP
jgi:4-amino-4-deoxy-L-arabinose transferase-like glycosyltransferase